jgi:hypothetical protein
LEKDNAKLNRKNKNLKLQNENLQEQNNLLIEELEISQKRLRKFIKRFSPHNICYSCDHFLDCGDIYLCVYCKKMVCSCCINFCRKEVGLEDNGDIKYCNISICSFCESTHDKCPSHMDMPEELRQELLNYYSENKFKKNYE